MARVSTRVWVRVRVRVGAKFRIGGKKRGTAGVRLDLSTED